MPRSTQAPQITRANKKARSRLGWGQPMTETGQWTTPLSR
jgi:hypothetical protein